MRRKRKVLYPTSRKTKGGAPAGDPATFVSPTFVAINLNAGVGRKDIVAGSRMTILGSGLYAGETAVVERVMGGGIPAELVRTEAGGARGPHDRPRAGRGIAAGARRAGGPAPGRRGLR